MIRIQATAPEGGPRATTVGMALAGAARPCYGKPVNRDGAAAEWLLDPVDPEIGSLPIHALAIALALKARMRGA